MPERIREPKIDQDDIDHAVRERLDVVVSLLRLLSTEEDVTEGGFNDDGLSTIRAACIATWDAAMYLAEEILEKTTGEQETSLLFDVQRFMAVAALALKSMTPDGPAWVEGPHSVRYLGELAKELLERASAEPEGEGSSEENNDDATAATTVNDGEDWSASRRALLTAVVALRESLSFREEAKPLDAGGLEYITLVVRPRVAAAIDAVDTVYAEGVILDDPEAEGLDLIYQVLQVARDVMGRATLQDDGSAVAGVYRLLDHGITAWHEGALVASLAARSAEDAEDVSPIGELPVERDAAAEKRLAVDIMRRLPGLDEVQNIYHDVIGLLGDIAGGEGVLRG